MKNSEESLIHLMLDKELKVLELKLTGVQVPLHKMYLATNKAINKMKMMIYIIEI